MQEVFIHSNNLTDGFHQSLVALAEQGELVDCADWNTTQKEISLTMVIDNPLSEPLISKCGIFGPEELEQYREETVDGILDFKAYDGTEEHTYHQLMADYIGINTNNEIVSMDQIQFVIDELKRNPSTRRAIIDIRNNIRDANSTNPTCLIYIQYFIRNNKLESKVSFRSNDACKAGFMDMFAFVSLQKYIAEQVGVEMGAYVHRANSYHCYARDFKMLDGFVKRIKEPDKLSVTFNYTDDWDELMAEAKTAIQNKMNLLRGE